VRCGWKRRYIYYPASRPNPLLQVTYDSLTGMSREKGIVVNPKSFIEVPVKPLKCCERDIYPVLILVKVF